MIPKPRPASFPVNQTPKAPQIVQPMEPKMGTGFSPVSRGGANGLPLTGSHQIPGPGNYNPPLDASPNLDGDPGSGQQLIKHYLLHAKEQAKKMHAHQQQQQLYQQQQQQLHQQQEQQQQQQHQQQQQQKLQEQQQILLHQQLQEELQRQMIMNNQMNMVQNQPSNQSPMPQPPPQTSLPAQPPQIPSNVFQHRNSIPQPGRRQDILTDIIPSAAVGALTSGLTPISIFSNLLNAYATLDSKHDITGMYAACYYIIQNLNQIHEISLR